MVAPPAIAILAVTRFSFEQRKGGKCVGYNGSMIFPIDKQHGKHVDTSGGEQ
ncbi:hypothetical protein EGYY_25800 [Eggerthella sp. YY7918]|nr:hypothetical protein EGYY_25800 [Eggerthella sp. YY7918]